MNNRPWPLVYSASPQQRPEERIVARGKMAHEAISGTSCAESV